MLHIIVAATLLLLAGCGGGSASNGGGGPIINGPSTVLEPPFAGCMASECTPEEIADIRRHNRQALRLRDQGEARRLDLPLQDASDTQQAPVVAFEMLSNWEITEAINNIHQDPDPNPGRGKVSIWRSNAKSHPIPDYLSVGVLPKSMYSGRWYQSELAPGQHYGTVQSYPKSTTVTEYLNQLGVESDRVNRDAVIRFREGTTPEEIDLTIRAVQAINSALPHQFRMRVDSNPKPLGEEPGAHEIAVTFAPQREWPGWEDVGPSPVAGVAVPFANLGSEVWIREPIVMRESEPDEDRIKVVAHEILHALGLWDHVEDALGAKLEGPPIYAGEGSSIMERGSGSIYLSGGVLYPLDRAGLLVAFNDMGPWNDTSIHFQRRMGLGDSHLDFGVYHGNGHAQAWAAGMHPETYLNDNPSLTGSATWTGHILGLTPDAASVAGNAALSLDLETPMTPLGLNFSGLEYWPAGQAPEGTGTQWGNGSLAYDVLVDGNTFTGGIFVIADCPVGGNCRTADEGIVTGAFFDPKHEGMGGTLERDDLTAAFGGRRGP